MTEWEKDLWHKVLARFVNNGIVYDNNHNKAIKDIIDIMKQESKSLIDEVLHLESLAFTDSTCDCGFCERIRRALMARGIS